MKKSIIVLITLILTVTVVLLADSGNQNQLKDNDGNMYKTIVIGDTEWSGENFRVKTDYNGNKLSCYVQDDAYGNLYDSKTLKRHSSFIPEGWRLPFEKELKALFSTYELTELLSPEYFESTGSMGFNLVPAGMYDFTGVFQWQGRAFVLAGLSDDSRKIVYYFYDTKKKIVKKGNFHPNDAVSIRLIRDVQ